MTKTAKEPISNEIIPDYWIISGQVFKNKEDFVKQQMEFNPGDIRENWESSFDHFAIPVYRNPIFVSEYENGVKTSFVRKNKVLQEQLNAAKYFFKNILDVDPNLNKGHVSHLENCVRVMKNSAEKALAAIGGDDDFK
ncbi:hypothetical protein [Lactococcus lactis]|uniref:hypothetical protein n=1 Tax=Lactococcus lactis TaxID=1358 RepID=UPI0023A9A071|nr:hypothetical protein [Lactococcus lactis]WEA55135.1 hypothetical protein PWP91_12785 [Lactococcus lactis]